MDIFLDLPRRPIDSVLRDLQEIHGVGYKLSIKFYRPGVRKFSDFKGV